MHTTLQAAPPSERLHPTSADTQRRLSAFNAHRLLPQTVSEDWKQRLGDEHEQRLLECRFVEAERRRWATESARVPKQPQAFVRWFEQLKETGPGQADPLFPWLAEQASKEQMCWFLAQEVAGEAGFEDLVALTQVKMPTDAKLELARNYWDEMGQGIVGGMHGPMLAALVQELELDSIGHEVVGEAVTLGNLMIALASHRHYAFQSVGALGVIELTAPGRASMVNAGLRRLGVPGAARRYFALHATLDVKHSLSWNREVLTTLVQETPAAAPLIAEGALMRLQAGKRCFERYRNELGATAALGSR